MSLIDSCGREVSYVRISLTDRCNYRCVYCMPEGGVSLISHAEILRYEDVHFLLGELEKWGVRKVRFTGGEPLVRKGIIGFLRDVKQRHKLLKVALTTNGALLAKFSRPLKEIKIDGINLSLDTLDEKKFSEITRGGVLGDVLLGIESLAGGGVPIKMNVVLMRDFNDMEIGGMIEFASRHGVTLRLIEFMPLDDDVWSQNKFISSTEVLERLGGEWREQKRENAPVPFGPARYYKNAQTGQKIGVISAVTSHYCAECNRLRITADGKLRPCLFSNFSLSLTDALRTNDAGELGRLFREALAIKPKIGVEQGKNEKRHMVQIGG